MNTRQKKVIASALFFVLGTFFLLYASCSALKKEEELPKQDIPPQTNQQPASNPPPQQSTQTPMTPKHAGTLNEQLGLVHGVGNDIELVTIPNHLTKKDEKIHTAVYEPLMNMIEHAQADGITLSIVSAYRSYDHQKRIWERKWGDKPDNDTNQALKNLEYSSFPGTSRHHWGTDVDFNSVSPAYWQSDEGRTVHQWLTKNAPLYGFCQTYGNHRTQGYANEDWHWSHMPTAERYYDQINNPQVLAIATNQPVRGAEAVRQLDTQLYGYIRGISPCHHTQANPKSVPKKAEQPPKPKKQTEVLPKPTPNNQDKERFSGQGNHW